MIQAPRARHPSLNFSAETASTIWRTGRRREGSGLTVLSAAEANAPSAPAVSATAKTEGTSKAAWDRDRALRRRLLAVDGALLPATLSR
jgi:hypothetical protein